MSQKKKKKSKKPKGRPRKVSIIDNSCYERYPLGDHKIWLSPKVTASKTTRITAAAAMKKAEKWATDIKAKNKEKIVDVLVSKNSILVVAHMYWGSKDVLKQHIVMLCEAFGSPSAKVEIDRKLGDLKHNSAIRLPTYVAPGTVRLDNPRPRPLPVLPRDILPETRPEVKVTIDDNLIYVGDQIGANAIKTILDNAIRERSRHDVKECIADVLNNIMHELKIAGYPEAAVSSIRKMLKELTVK